MKTAHEKAAESSTTDSIVDVKEEKTEATNIKLEYDENQNICEPTSTEDDEWEGKICWALYKNINWYPCIILKQLDDDKFEIGFLTKSTSNKSVVRRKRLYEFRAITGNIRLNFNKEIAKVYGRKHRAALACNRDIESARIFYGFPKNLRVKIFNEVQRCKLSKKQTIDATDDISSLTNQYLAEMVQYDKAAATVKHERVQRKALKKEPEIKLIIKDRQLPARCTAKRELCIEDSKPFSEKVIEISPKPPRPKKPKIEPKKETLQELFITEHIEVDKDVEFRSFRENFVCSVCLHNNDNDIFIECSGNCNERLHPHCFQLIEKVEESTSSSEEKFRYFCTENCKKETCCVCNEVRDNDMYECKQPKCRLSYHRKCLKFLSKSSKSCLKHFCHTCYLKESARDGPIVTCIDCPLSYHADILCLPVGTQVVSKTQIICPKHKPEEAKQKLVNLDFCVYCSQHGQLILCDSCPRAFHLDCMPQCLPKSDDKKVKCFECQSGVEILYNTVVWSKVKNYRWWPAFVLIPWTVPIKMVEQQKSDYEFCVRFLGTHEFCFLTSERVIGYDPLDSLPKVKSYNNLDAAFEKSLVEAKELIKILENKESIELENTDEKERAKGNLYELKSSKRIYRSIQICRPVPPVKLKKSKPEPCKCTENDRSPCSYKSSCINITLQIECDENCPAGRKCQNQKVRNRENANMKIMKTRNRGFGAFCVEDIQPQTFIIEYVGELIDKKELRRRMELKKKRNEKDYYFLTVQSNLSIDAEYYSNKGRFINHSCDPNCDVRKITVDGITRMGIFSNQFIKAGTELTFNYQMEFGRGTGIKCNCGSSKCIGVIGRYSK